MSFLPTEHHQCTTESSNNILPILSPSAGIFTKLWRAFRETTLPSYKHWDSKYYFKSHASLTQEKLKTIRTFTIHPCSAFSLGIEIIAGFVFILHFLLRVYYHTFNERSSKVLLALLILSSILKYMHIFILFFTGYRKGDHMDFELNFGKIVKQYLKTYFIVDVIIAFPFDVIFIYADDTIKHWLAFGVVVGLLLMHCIRSRYFGHLLTNLLWFLRIPAGSFYIVKSSVYLIFTLHMYTCALYALAQSLPDKEKKKYFGGIDWHGYNMYLVCLHKILCYYIPSGYGKAKTEQPYEMLLLTLVLITSTLMQVNVIAYIFVCSKKRNSPDNRYELALDEILKFVKEKKLPDTLAQRAILCFQYKHKKKLFLEAKIVNSLTRHLKYELALHKCTHMIAHSGFLRLFPRDIVGQILAAVEQIIFEPNEIINRFDEEGWDLYFISFGTCAYFHTNGNEVGHLKDGDVVGLSKYANSTHNGTAVALDFMETYKLHAKDLKHMFSLSDSFRKLFYRNLHQTVKTSVTHLGRERRNGGTNYISTYKFSHIIEARIPRR